MVLDRIAELLEKFLGAGTKTASATTITVINTTMTVADTEYSYVIPTGTRALSLSVIDGLTTENYRLAFVTGKVATPVAPFIKKYADQETTIDGLTLTGNTIYFACSGTGRVMQITAEV